MNNKIIEVLDYLGEKIGLAIDWSANNVYPQVMEFLTRYRTYEIVTDALWVLLGIAIIFFYVRFLTKRLYPDYVKSITEKKDTEFFDYWNWKNESNATLLTMLILAFGGIAAVVSICVALCGIADIAKWIFIPEAQFYHMIAGLIQ